MRGRTRRRANEEHDGGPQRREFLGLALGGALAAAGSRSGVGPAAAEPLGQPVPFAADTVLKAAAQLAAAPFKAPDAPLP